MAFEVASLDDLVQIDARARVRKTSSTPQVLDVSELLALEVPVPGMLVENVLPAAGASLMFGAPKSNKTLFAVQIGIAVASGHSLCNHYPVITPGPVLMVEQDDPAGAASLKGILSVSPVPVGGIPFFLAPRVPFTFGKEFIDWLEKQITVRGLRLCILDSYTALRGSRSSGIDIAKAEQGDLAMLDELAKRTASAILIIHHSSKGSAGLDWSGQAAGTFAMSASTEAQIHVSRFGELDSNSPERLVRVRARHLEGTEMVIRFRKESLDHEHVFEGGAAPLYPLMQHLRTAFGSRPFGPRDLSTETGVSRATVTRWLDRLLRADVLEKRGYGEYVLKEGI